MTRGHVDGHATPPPTGRLAGAAVGVAWALVSAATVAAALWVALGGMTGPPAAAQQPDEPDEADVEQAREKLRALQARHQLAVQEYLEAEARLSDLDAEIRQSRARIEELSARMEQRRDGAESVARQLYTSSSAASGMAVLGASDVSEAGRRAAYLQHTRRRHRAAIEKYRSTRVKLDRETQQLRTARTEAAGLREELAQRAERIDAEAAEQQAEIAALREQIEERRARERRARQRALAQQRAEQASRQRDDGGGDAQDDADADPAAPQPASTDPGGGSSDADPAADSDPAPSEAPAPSDGASTAVQAAMSRRGMPYQWGAQGPDSFDCSGLTMWAWQRAGVSIPRTSSAQYRGLPNVPRSEIRPGDLLFFGDPIHHVGMYIGDGQMVEAPYSGQPVRVNDIQRPDYVGAARPG